MLDPVELFPEVPNIYAFPSVHADLLFDKSRVTAYRDAIRQTVKEGDVVADLGAGTGLLTFLCLQAGAAKVHAIERSEVIEWAKELAAKNGFTDRIEFHECDAREADLGEKVDVIVSELMGHVAFEEGMAETICVAKDRFLTPDGVSIPQTVTLRAALVHEEEIYRNSIDVWDTVEGIDYSTMREKALQNAYVTDIPGDHIFSDSQTVMIEDFTTHPKDLHETFIFTTLRAGSVNGLAFWFDADLTEKTRLSSSPWTKTHWQQCYVPFSETINVVSGKEISIKIDFIFKKDKDDKFLFTCKYVNENSNAQ